MNYVLQHRTKRGAALLIAISMLGLFTVLGMVYVRHMNIEIDQANMTVNETRTQNAAVAGIEAALGDLQRALLEKQLTQAMTKPLTYPLNTYKAIRGPEGLALDTQENRTLVATVSITDESGKINLNHAPASVLQAILNVDGTTARNITGSLPRGGARPEGLPEQQWFVSIEDLRSRNLLTPEQFAAVNPAFITTFTVADHAAPAGFLNINAAPVEVLAAIVDLPVETVRTFENRRPFSSLATLGTAAGKDPATFNYKPDPNDPAALPAALAFESRCFRLSCEAVFCAIEGKNERPLAKAHAEAVALFTPDCNGYQLVYWNTQQGASGA
ncbi:MAG TPA: type II secretion system protein GspK [Candidatus Hydrogenedentes bacterium]|nr:type II secretion system protein GspK [Candidatus Hydrogenedentota bacterium]